MAFDLCLPSPYGRCSDETMVTTNKKDKEFQRLQLKLHSKGFQPNFVVCKVSRIDFMTPVFACGVKGSAPIQFQALCITKTHRHSRVSRQSLLTY